jgi:hypothetical protein
MTKSTEEIKESYDKLVVTMQRLLCDCEYLLTYCPTSQAKKIIDSYYRKINKYQSRLNFLEDILENIDYAEWIESVNSEIEELIGV